MDLEAICNWQASNICKIIMTWFLTFTDNQTPPSERQNISENDQEFEDNHNASNFESKSLSIFNLVGKGYCEASNNSIDIIPKNWLFDDVGDILVWTSISCL